MRPIVRLLVLHFLEDFLHAFTEILSDNIGDELGRLGGARALLMNFAFWPDIACRRLSF